MADYSFTTAPGKDPYLKPAQILKHAGLFVITFAMTTFAGLMWQGEFDLANFQKGLPYSIALLFILSCHEFGHYFAARHHKVLVTLPYYIPLPPLPNFLNFGTLGAVIKTKAPIPSKNALFDIGIAGPIAGFVASIIVLIFGFMNLPGKEFLLSIHPDYNFSTGQSMSAMGPVLTFGSSLMYDTIGALFTPAGAYVPPMSEMYHYPYLVTGWFGLLVTALNLLPAGQLDGGHISYSMFGTRHGFLARFTVIMLFLFGGIGVLPGLLDLAGLTDIAIAMMEAIPGFESMFWPGWLFWALLITFVIKVKHPPIAEGESLNPERRLLGWLAWAIFLVCFSPAPIFFA